METAATALNRINLNEIASKPSNAQTKESLYRYSDDKMNEYRTSHWESLWIASGCPKRHREALGARMGEDWGKAFGKVKERQGSGLLFLLAGQRGTGKTQIAVELIFDLFKETVERQLSQEDYYHCPKSPAYYSLVIDFFMKIKATYRKEAKETDEEVIKRFVAYPLLVLDEITVRGETKWEDDLFFSMLDKRYNAKRDTILIGNLKASEAAANVGPSIASRIQECGGVIECNWQSFRSNKQ